MTTAIATKTHRCYTKEERWRAIFHARRTNCKEAALAIGAHYNTVQRWLRSEGVHKRNVVQRPVLAFLREHPESSARAISLAIRPLKAHNLHGLLKYYLDHGILTRTDRRMRMGVRFTWSVSEKGAVIESATRSKHSSLTQQVQP